jgi:hypothetical protein
MAHCTCSNTLSLSVLENLRTTTAFASGRASTSSTMATLTKLDFVLPRPPCSQ